MKQSSIAVKLFSVVLSAALASSLLAGCANAGAGSDSAASETKKELKYSKSQGPYSALFEDGVKPILEEKGYSFEGVDLSDLLQADISLNDGEVDFNVEQHTAYMKDFNEKQGGHLAAVTPIPTVPAGIYPGSKTTLDQIADGAKVAVPNDASNTARAYVLLQKAGWITLKDGVDPTLVTQQDIAENPHNIQFTEMKSLNIPAVRGDFDFIVITGSIVYNAKIDPSTALLTEDILPDLFLQVVVREQDKDAQWAKDIAAAYQSEEFAQYLQENNNGLWQAPDYSQQGA